MSGERRRPLDDWSFRLDEHARWEDADLARLDRLPVVEPSGGWATLDSGEAVRVPSTTYDLAHGYRGVSWWSTEVACEGAGGLVLRFGGVRLLAEVFWDRQRIAVDLEGLTPFEVRVPDELATAGTHRLDLRVTDPGGGDTWDDIRPVSWGSFELPASHAFGGPWQPIEAHETGGRRIADVWARPDRELGRALVDVEVEASGPASLRVEIADPDGRILATEERTAAGGTSAFAFDVEQPRPYGPGQPNRYTCRVTLDDDHDTATVPFGFRLLDVAHARLVLNGEPLRVASAISWGHYRRGPIPSEGDVEREVASMLAFGHNTFTAHRCPSTPALQDALEAHGLLLYQEPGAVGGPMFASCRPESRPFVLALALERIRRLARRDRSRACLAWWNMANEWHDVDMASWPEYVDASLEALRSVDDSRLTTFTSGWGETPMLRPFDQERRRSWDYHRVFCWPNIWQESVATEVEIAPPPEPMLTIDGESACFTSLGRLREIAAAFPSEAPDDTPAGRWRRWIEILEDGLAAADPDGRLGGLDAFCRGTAEVQTHGFARLIEAHRRHPDIDGLTLNGWHQHHRVGTSGIVAPDRSPVGDPTPIHRANQPRALAFRTLPRVMRAGRPHRAEVEVIGPRGSDGPTEATVTLHRDGWEAWRGGAGAIVPPDAGLYEVHAVSGGLEVADRILAVGTPAPPSAEIAVFDPYEELGDWFAEHGVRVRSWTATDPGPALFTVPRGLMPHRLAGSAARRVAVLHRNLAHGHVMTTMGSAAAGSLPPPPTLEMMGSWIGGWAFSVDDVLPNLGPPGVWGAERLAMVPTHGIPDPGGRWVSGICSFPDADLFDIRMPGLGATTWIQDTAAPGRMLHTVLPILERRDHPLGAAVLMDILHWLNEEDR